VKILLTVHQFFPKNTSGTEVLTYEFAKELLREGYEVKVFTATPNASQEKDKDRFGTYVYDGIVVEQFFHNNKPMGDQSNQWEMEYDNHLFYSYFLEYLKREKPDIVHFFHLMNLSASAIDACHRLGIPTVFTPTDFWFICPTFQLRLPDNSTCPGPDKLGFNCLKHKLQIAKNYPKVRILFNKIPDPFIIQLILLARAGFTFHSKYLKMIDALSKRQDFLRKRINLIDRVLVPTQIVQTKLIQFGLQQDKIIQIPFGLNLSAFRNIHKRVQLNKLRIGFIGTISEPKGVHILIEAIHKIEEPLLELKIYGNTEIDSFYSQRIREIADNDPRIKFMGTFPNDEIGKVFASLDVLVVPSLWYENSPLVIYSAQAAGCPVIASDFAGLAEIVEHNKNGFLFQPGNIHQLQEEINTLFKDRSLLNQLSNNAKKPLSMHDYAIIVLEIYKNLVSGGRAG